MSKKQSIALLSQEISLLGKQLDETVKQIQIKAEQIKAIQNECEHDFIDRSFIVSRKECKLCGYTEIGL